MTIAPVRVETVVPAETEPVSRKPKGRRGLVMTLVLAVTAIFWISPLALLVITAVRPLADFIGNGPLSWPDEFTWSNFKDAWGIGNFATTYRNSAFLALMKVPLGVAAGRPNLVPAEPLEEGVRHLRAPRVADA